MSRVVFWQYSLIAWHVWWISRWSWGFPLLAGSTGTSSFLARPLNSAHCTISEHWIQISSDFMSQSVFLMTFYGECCQLWRMMDCSIRVRDKPGQDWVTLAIHQTRHEPATNYVNEDRQAVGHFMTLIILHTPEFHTSIISWWSLINRWSWHRVSSSYPNNTPCYSLESGQSGIGSSGHKSHLLWITMMVCVGNWSDWSEWWWFSGFTDHHWWMIMCPHSSVTRPGWILRPWPAETQISTGALRVRAREWLSL